LGLHKGGVDKRTSHRTSGKIHSVLEEITFAGGSVPSREEAHLASFDPGNRAIAKNFVPSDRESRIKSSMGREIVINSGPSGIGLPPACVGFDDGIGSENPMGFCETKFYGAQTWECAQRI